MALKIFSQSSILFKIGAILVLIAFILCFVSFVTAKWESYDIKYGSQSYGLWQICVEDIDEYGCAAHSQLISPGKTTVSGLHSTTKLKSVMN